MYRGATSRPPAGPPGAAHAAFRDSWRAVKRQNKAALGVGDPDALHDVMIKRFHEYKRQLLKVLHVATLHQRRLAGATMPARVVLFGGKAAPSYHAAKSIIHLINRLADLVRDDPYVTVVFPPNYNVTLAERIVPAADLSEQISLAGKEASGTGNMKLALNGALTIGTLDGANIEIRDRVGAENFFLFGLDARQASELRAGDYRPRDLYEADPELKAAVDLIGSLGFGDVVDSILGRDEYLALADYRAYVDAQDRVDAAWQDPDDWARMSILNTARCGFFSSDRTVADYCATIWKIT
ncbi:glycogen/starch/alpha-glucan phosphorylase [Actinoplanes sp. NPDC051633]|uniref:glycogen/starch/alpha-glucan phosphorylase n=1 Tax=Actinoplanes sp. NPDC051633 TaxID=3155670 RepID=UPI0034180EDE